MRRLIYILGAVIAAAFVIAAVARAQSALAPETVKAAFVARFASFVQWPPGAFNNPEAPIRVCIMGGGGASPSSYARILAGQAINGHSFEVRRLTDSALAQECHILVVTGGAGDEPLRAVRGHPVLTVTDAESGGARGIMHFAVVQDHVRFHIDDAQAAESGLFISSRLLALAVSVRRRGG